MQLKHLAAASLLAVSTFAAQAAAVPPGGDLGTLTDKPELFYAFNSGVLPQFLTYTYDFTVGGLSDVIGSVASVNGVTFSEVLIGTTSLALTPNTSGLGFSMAGLSEGSYTLTVKATFAPGFSGYIGSLYAQPVPEPETIALMLAGLGVVGVVAARRKAH